MTKQRREKDAKQKNNGHGSTFLKHVFNTGRDKGQAKNHDQNTSLAGDLNNSTEKGTNKRLRSNSDRRFKYTAERSKTSQTHQRVDVLNTDHKDVAVFRESSRIFTFSIWCERHVNTSNTTKSTARKKQKLICSAKMFSDELQTANTTGKVVIIARAHPFVSEMPCCPLSLSSAL